MQEVTLITRDGFGIGVMIAPQELTSLERALDNGDLIVNYEKDNI